MKMQRLMRTWYATDLNSVEDPVYVGAFSEPFPAEQPDRQVVAVDWSKPGEVEVTWLVRAEEEEGGDDQVSRMRAP